MTWAADIDRDGARRKAVVWSTTDVGASLTPEVALARAREVAARDGVASLTLDELTLAAVCASEDGTGTPEEIAALCDATLNRAAAHGRSVLLEATAGQGFGHSGRVPGTDPPKVRPMSTAIAPQLRHVRAAVAVTRGPARGVALGARMWFHHRTQARLARSKPATHCAPAIILERWAFDCAWEAGKRCVLGPRRRRAMQWVGPVAGLDHYKVFMFSPATAGDAGGAALHQARYDAARAILDGAAGRVGPTASDALVVGLALLGALS